MDHKVLSLKEQKSRKRQQGFALIMVFSVAIIVLTLIASLYWTSVQRHTLMRKRGQHARALYLTEAGMYDAIARLRIGNPPPEGINPAAGRWYCLDIETSTITADFGACAGVCAPPADVRVCVSNNAGGRNQIDVVANF